MNCDSPKSKQHFTIKISILVGLCIGFALLLTVFFGRRGWEEGNQETGAASLPLETSSDSTSPGQEDFPLNHALNDNHTTQQDMLVMTPYCNLHYPGEWSGSVRTDTEITANGCIVTFYGIANSQEVDLFSVFFAEGSENSFPVGSISLNGLFVDVSVELSDFAPSDTWKTADADDISAMQEGVNYLISKLEENSAFTPVAQSQQENNERTAEDTEIVIEAAYCDLYFPAQWKDAVRLKETKTEIGDIITFYGTVNEKESVLFSIYFAESSDKSFPIGVLDTEGMEIDVSIEIPALSDDSGWSDADRALFYRLQETVNYVIERLRDDPNYTPA